MTKRKPVASDQQSARFLEAAKKAEVDESGRAFAKAFKKVVRPSRPTNQSSQKAK